MAQFTLTWDALATPNNANALIVKYRVRGSTTWIQLGSPLAPTATTYTTANTFSDNIVYEFIITTDCDENDSDNSGGKEDGFNFDCITPTTVETETTSVITLNVTGLHIKAARFILEDTNGNTVMNPIKVAKVGNTISTTASNLTAGTSYYWIIELYADVNGVEVRSSTYMECALHSITTDGTSVEACEAVESFDVESVKV